MTRTTRHVLAGLALFAMAACGSSNTARYLIDAPSDAGQVTRVATASVELRTVSLPSHASAAEILLRDNAGALAPLGNAVWADEPERAVTGTLAHLLDTRSTAVVSAAPWPLQDGPVARLDIRIDKMLADASGVFVLTGQASVSAVVGPVREQVKRFAITVPMDGLTAPAVTDAQGRALVALADDAIALLR